MVTENYRYHNHSHQYSFLLKELEKIKKELEELKNENKKLKKRVDSFFNENIKF